MPKCRHSGAQNTLVFNFSWLSDFHDSNKKIRRKIDKSRTCVCLNANMHTVRYKHHKTKNTSQSLPCMYDSTMTLPKYCYYLLWYIFVSSDYISNMYVYVVLVCSSTHHPLSDYLMGFYCISSSVFFYCVLWTMTQGDDDEGDWGWL